MASIVLQGISKTYVAGVHALNDLNLSINNGELLVLVGPSGCGKTTTLRIIAGLEEPTCGTLHLGGRSMLGVPPWQRGVAMVFQKPALIPGRDVRYNIMFSNELCRRSPKVHPQPTPSVEEVAGLLRLTDLLGRSPDQLSGGEQQRVSLGKVLIQQASVQLLDEPLGHLDGPLRCQLRRDLHLFHQQFPATMVYVTHDPQEALALGDRIAVLENGTLQQLDRPEVLLNRPRNRFVAEFFQGNIGPMTFLEGQCLPKDQGLVFQTEEGSLPIPASRIQAWQKYLHRPAILGVRAEDIFIQWNEPTKGWPMTVLLVETSNQGKLLACTAGHEPRRPGVNPGWQQRVTAFLDRREQKEFAVADQLRIEFRLDEAFLFDRASGLNLETTR